jgi:hypothetical protein
MVTQQPNGSQGALVGLAQEIAAWAATLDSTQQAMLIDLLAKAGADVYGSAAAGQAVAPEGRPVDGSALSPLELRDFEHAIVGILDPDGSHDV